MAEPVRNDADLSALAAAIGPQLLIRMTALIRTAHTYDASNQTFQRQMTELFAVVQKLLDAQPDTALAASSGYFYLGGARIRASASLLPVYHALLQEFERRGLAGLRFSDGLTQAELERFFQLFVAAEDPLVAEQVFADLQAANIDHLTLITPADVADEASRELAAQGEPTSERGRAQRTFWRAVLGTKSILTRAQATGRPDLRHAKRLVQPFVDQIMNHEYSVVGLTAIKDHDEYTYAHCVNVAILSVGIGHSLGLSRQALADLGVAALLHDVGKLAVPGDVLRKPSKLDQGEWNLMRRHPIEGVRMLFRLPGVSPLTVDAMRACMEHHMNYDGSGYPQVGASSWRQCAQARIVAMADCFDAMTAHRAYHRRPFTPFEALQYLLGTAKTSFDPAVRWALVRTVGLYPPGTVMITESGTAVLSIAPNPDDLRRPHCRVLVHADGRTEPEEGGETWSPMPASEHVQRVPAPEDLQVDTGEYLAAA